MPHAAPRVADIAHSYKSCSRLNVAKSVVAPLPPSKGYIPRTAIRILSTFEPRSSLSFALSSREIAERTGIPRRTVNYWLRKLVAMGYVARVGKPRSPSTVYTLTYEGVRALTSSNFPLTQFLTWQSALQTTRAGPTFPREFAKTIRVVPLPPLALRWWVELDGKVPGFRELGFRLPARRLLRWLKGLGLLERRRKRVKRVVVYAKGKTVHVDVATSLAPDEALLLGPSAHWREYVFAYVSVAAAALAAGVDKRLLHSLLAALRV